MAEIVKAGAFATEGERRAAGELANLPADWIVICNKVLPTANGRTFEIDFIVIGKRHVFLIDEKSWYGQIRGSDQIWVRADGASVSSPLNKVDYIAGILAEHVRIRVPALSHERGHFVRAGVLLSLSERVPPIKDPRIDTQLFIFNTICARLIHVDQSGGNPLVGQHSTVIRDKLVDLSDRPTVPSEIGIFTIEDASDGLPGTRILHAKIPGGERRTLYLYDLGRDPLSSSDRRTFYLREFQTLRSLRDTGLVAEVKDPFPWSDDYLVVPVEPLSGKSLGAMAPPQTRDDVISDLLLAEACFKGLDRIHARKILHRAISPGSIQVLHGGTSPRIAFTNFHAARVEEASIALSLDVLQIEEPYAAPALASSYGLATTATDLFSLALVFIVRMSGTTVQQLRDTGIVTVPNFSAQWPSLPADVMDELGTLMRSLVIPGSAGVSPAGHTGGQAPRSAATVAGLIGDLARRLRIESTTEVIGRVLDSRYEIIQVLGQGAMARTYLVKDTIYSGIGVFALKQFMYPSVVLAQAANEFNTLQQISSRYLPRIFEIYPPQNDAHIKLEYIPGPTLEAVKQEFPWPLERWWSFAQQLLEAIEALERRQLLHRDVKPSNIILHDEDGRVVLIDFGFATSQGAEAQAAGTLLYQPPEAQSAATPPLDSDRYAASVVMFRVLTNALPFEGRDRSRPTIPDQIEGQVRRLAYVLLDAVSPDPAQRPKSVAELRDRLRTAMQSLDAVGEQLPAHMNPWADKVRGLYRNSSAGNADNRGLDSDFVRQTYVPTALDTQLLPEIFQRRPRAIFLSGNPGDGKTAFLEQVRAELARRGGVEHQADASGWEIVYEDHTYRSCYDASESHNGHSADEQLTTRLRGLEGDTPPEGALTVLVAINDGRLADYFERLRSTFTWLGRLVERTLTRGTDINAQVWLIDLKQRAFVQLPGVAQPSILLRVLDQLVEPTQWELCEECVARSLCPIRRNALMLRSPVVRPRLEHLFLIAHLRRQRHITMRDLRSALAYLITGNLSCADVHTAQQDDDGGASLILHSYWQSAFAPLEQSDELLGDMSVIDPANQPQPHLDRYLHFRQAPADAPDRRALFITDDDLPVHRFADEREWMGATKRRLYFEAVEPAAILSGGACLPWSALLPYRYASEYIEVLAGHVRPQQILARLALGVLRSDGVFINSPASTLSVVVSHSTVQQLIVLKRFPLDAFFLNIQKPRSTGLIEAIPEVLVLEHRAGTPRLEITLELYDLLMRLADGLQSDAPEFRPLLEDLAPFKSTLLLRETRDLILVENQRRVYTLEQRDGKIILGSQQEIPR